MHVFFLLPFLSSLSLLSSSVSEEEAAARGRRSRWRGKERDWGRGIERVLREADGASKGMMVLLEPQVHLQKEVGFAVGFLRERKKSVGSGRKPGGAYRRRRRG